MRVATGLVAVALTGVALTACGADSVAREFPAGACVRFQGSPDGENATIGHAECSGPHTHVVTVWLRELDASCPSPATEKMLTPDGTLCLRADPPASG